MRMKRALAAALGVAAILGAWFLHSRDSYVPRPLPPPRPSDGFKATVMVPTLETPIPASKSAIWCGAFQLAWNRMKTDVAKEPLRIQGAEALCTILNACAFNDADLTPESFYAAAGLEQDGIEARIRREMGERFPGVSPELTPVPGRSAVAYAYLAAGLRFTYAYVEQKEGVPFREGSGRLATVRGFGVRSSESHAYRDAYRQPRVLYHGPDEPPREYVVDLDPKSGPQQIVLAMMKRPTTLAEGIAWVEKNTASGDSEGFRGGESLIVPEVAMGIVHHFAELEGPDRVFLNPVLREDYVAVARQFIQFRLDRGGAELRAEAEFAAAKAAMPSGAPLQLLFDRPFLLLMKKRGASRPYFAVWIDNLEILEPR
jgi:hypothetical protein